ncbi:hypothetical protein HK405_008135 [Cladochytrium tenue]|nr:hypothetical protein HK405_008135 [Cladochytrium tenue]
MSSELHTTRQHGSLEEALEEGCEVTAVRPHEQNENVSVYVKTSDDEEMVFTNVSPEHVKEYEEKYPSMKKKLREGEVDIDPSKHKTFLDFVQEKGAYICDWHPTERGTYSVHVKTPDGAKHVFTSVRVYLGLPDGISTNRVALLCTSFDSYSQLLSKYPESKEILSALGHYPNVQVRHGINAWELSSHFRPAGDQSRGRESGDDATRLPEWRDGRRVDGSVGFNTVAWNHPHLGTEDFRLHRFLMAHFFSSVAAVLQKDSARTEAETPAAPASVVVSLVRGQEVRWDLVGQAQRSGLALADDGSPFAFDDDDWPGYVAKRNKHGKSFKNAATQRRHQSSMASRAFRFVRAEGAATAAAGSALPGLEDLAAILAADDPPGGEPSMPVQPGRTKVSGPESKAAQDSTVPAASSGAFQAVPRSKKELRSLPIPADFSCPYCCKPLGSSRAYLQHVLQVHIYKQFGADWTPTRPRLLPCRGSPLSPSEEASGHTPTSGCGKLFKSEGDRWQHEVARHSSVDEEAAAAAAAVAARTTLLALDGDGDGEDSAGEAPDYLGVHSADYEYVPCDVCGQSVPRKSWGLKVHLESLKPAVGLELECPNLAAGCAATFIEARAMFQHFRFCRLRHAARANAAADNK